MNLKNLENLPDYLDKMGYIIDLKFSNNKHQIIAYDESNGKVITESSERIEAMKDIKLKVTLVELNKPSISSDKLLIVGLGNTPDDKTRIEQGLGSRGKFIMARIDSLLKEHLLLKSSNLNPESSNPHEAKKGCSIVSYIKDYYKFTDDEKRIIEIDKFLNGETKFKNLSTEILNLYAVGVQQYMEVLRKENQQHIVKPIKPNLTIVK